MKLNFMIMPQSIKLPAANLGRGDYVWLEKTYSNSDVYKIVAVIHFSAFQPDAGPDDTPVNDSTGTGADSTGTSMIP